MLFRSDDLSGDTGAGGVSGGVIYFPAEISVEKACGVWGIKSVCEAAV